MSRSRLLPLMLPGLLASCATPSVTLLPTEDGKQGAVAVIEENGKPRETVINELNSRTNLSGQPKTKSIDPAKLSALQRSLLDNLPPKPVELTLYFQEKTKLTAELAAGLEYLKAEIKRRPGAEVQVTGYTDTVGSMAENDELSQRRAEDILSVLTAQGIDLSLMSAVGRGERDLREPTADNVPNQANRRVVVTIR